MMETHLISLTPNFSWVFTATSDAKPFQRFFATSFQAVETASDSLGRQSTWLKPGVNETAACALAPES
jgi:hypothetical protein